MVSAFGWPDPNTRGGCESLKILISMQRTSHKYNYIVCARASITIVRTFVINEARCPMQIDSTR